MKKILFGLMTVIALHGIAQAQQRYYQQPRQYLPTNRMGCRPEGRLVPIWKTFYYCDRWGRTYVVNRIVGWRMVYDRPYDLRQYYQR